MNPSPLQSRDPSAVVENSAPAPLVSIITTVYNQENYIADAIASVRSQTCASWECIIVDDGSKDQSYANARMLTQGDPRFKIVTKPNGGLSSARNAGIPHLAPQSRYIVFLDGDDLLAPEFLSQLSNYLEAHPEAGLVTCGFIELDQDARPVKEGYRSRYAPNALGFPHQLKPGETVTPFATFFCATGQGPFTMVRRAIYEQTPGYDERLCPHEDTDMFCHLALRAEAHHLPTPLYLKRNNETSIMNSKTEDAAKRYAYFRADAYSIFRNKWDHYPADDPRQRALIDEARNYYYTRHRPFRDFKVALKTLRLIFKNPSRSQIAWFLQLCKSGLRGLFNGGGPAAK
jgi:glycosyltransferase involved in cell wall biosynthesis